MPLEVTSTHKIFELRKPHIALVRALRIKPETLSLIGSNSKLSPFSDGDLLFDLGNIIVGKELTDEEKIDKHEAGESFLTRDKEDELLSYYKDLTVALEIILNTMSFEEGIYRTRAYMVDWKKIGDVA